jgi:hypothetical protein
MAAFAGSVLRSAALLSRRQLRSPPSWRAHPIAFADGTVSWVFRETVRRGTDTRRPALLVVRFRLRLARRSALLHACFRVESVLHTPLFAGFPGFRSKLWLTDQRTGVYRGVYEWDGADRARRYAVVLSALLRRISEVGSVDFHVVPGVHRDDALRDPAGTLPPLADIPHNPGPWWRPRAVTLP